MGIIDFRVRPLYAGYQALAANGTTDKFLDALGYSPSASIQQRSLSLLVDEMDAAGIEIAVVPGRMSPSTHISNAELLELRAQYPDRFIIFPLFDPLRPEESLAEIEETVVYGPGKGVTIEPGFGNELKFDDAAYYPLYTLLEKHHLPLMTTFSGSITKYMDATLVQRFHRVAKDFPGMDLIAGHGGWPWAREMICMAFFCSNVYLAPDLYATNCPGSQDYREAANHMLRERMLFGSSYPLVPVADAVTNAKQWSLTPAAEACYLHDNAARLLGLQ